MMQLAHLARYQVLLGVHLSSVSLTDWYSQAELGNEKEKRVLHMAQKESHLEQALIKKLTELKYVYRPEIRDRAALEQNFRAHFQELNQVNLSDAEFSHLLDDLIKADVFTAAQTLRERNTFQREDGTALQYTLVNIKDWCKNVFEVVNQLRINTDKSSHRYDVMLLINGVPVVREDAHTGARPGRVLRRGG